jgi:hypothetical protein
MHYLSLGYACDVATQIRAHTGVSEAYFFNWLMSPRESLDILLRSDESVLRGDRWDLIQDDTCLRDLDSGLLFMHEFPVTPPAAGQPRKILAADVERHLPAARAKFAYLRRKTLALIRECPHLVLVRAINLELDEALAELNHIRSLYLPLNPRLRFVLASERLPGHATGEGDSMLFRTNPGPDWAGDAVSWSALFQSADRLFGPAAMPSNAAA